MSAARDLIHLPEPAAGFAPARLEVRPRAIASNYRECQKLATGAEVAGVVKADGYGLGAAEAARTLADVGCETFFVARLPEGVALRPLIPQARIFVLDGAQPDSIAPLIAHRLTPVLNSLDEIALWQKAAKAAHTTFDTAIHFDTGMNRSGMPPDELAVLSAEARTRLAHLNVVLAMSHLACAEDPGHAMNGEQLSRFRAGLARLPPAKASLAASGGILLGRDYTFDLVRPGLALYGGNPCPARANPFAVAARWTARILQSRRVDRGETVGYAASFRIERPSVLATVALGYADGLMRAAGNRAQAAIGATRVPVVGRVSMDLTVLDVTDCPDGVAVAGADAEFLGDIITLEELAASSNTAPYEILTSLRGRVPRHYEAAQ